MQKKFNFNDRLDGYGMWHGHRARRGDISSLILTQLSQKPMHGYEIINALEEKSHGLWRPSAGSVYPTLQMLEDQDMLSSKEANGKRIYALTEKGKEAAKTAESDHAERWEKRERYALHFLELKPYVKDIMISLHRIAGEDSNAKTQKVKTILQETKNKLNDLID
jgi:DNA-binding PadR family transcriptional regulator